MGIGLGIFFIALGLILALGVRDRISDVDLSVIGWILTGVGALAIVLTLLMTSLRSGPRRRVIEERDERDDLL
jgi:hypothetical protein